ncbi:MAG: glycosyltransferase [Blastocatellia bacterium]
MKNFSKPALTVVIPTFNNLNVLKRCLDSWQQFEQGQAIEILVIEDGCRDGTQEYLTNLAESDWGRRCFRWYHEDDVHELKCTNRGFSESRAPLILVWQDDMFLQAPWFVRELISNFDRHNEIGLLSLTRGLNCFPLDEPISEWEDLLDWRRLQSTIGTGSLNWFRLQEVDAVIRPWVVRRACLDKVGMLDEAFRPTEWDEADLCFRIRKAGWKIATHGYERVGAYKHLGSSTLNQTFSPEYKQRVLRNGQLFHKRWDDEIGLSHSRFRRTWWRQSDLKGRLWTLQQMLRLSDKTAYRLETSEQNT